MLYEPLILHNEAFWPANLLETHIICNIVFKNWEQAGVLSEHVYQNIFMIIGDKEHIRCIPKPYLFINNAGSEALVPKKIISDAYDASPNISFNLLLMRAKSRGLFEI